MAKDKRIKGCYNLECKRYRKEYKYEPTDNFCTICGTPLVFVCAECFEKIEDQGAEHRLCEVCEAKHQAKREALAENVGKMKNVAVLGIGVVPKAIDFAKSDTGKKIIKKGVGVITKKKM